MESIYGGNKPGSRRAFSKDRIHLLGEGALCTQWTAGGLGGLSRVTAETETPG